jgi:hypothetical protein
MHIFDLVWGVVRRMMKCEVESDDRGGLGLTLKYFR